MGYGRYSLDAHRQIARARATRPVQAVFLRNDCDPDMNPRGVRFRECRDSEAHPASNAIVFALDVSGSMEEIPHQLATATLPTFMEHVSGLISDPQVMVMAFGNAYADASPLQVGQFESEAERIDHWLASVHLEGGGGGLGESYGLAMYFAAHHTAMDCFEKRGRKGYFFMTGDEVTFAVVDRGQVAGLIGDVLETDIPMRDAVVALQQKFHAFFLIPDQARAAREECGVVWRLLLRQRCVVLRDTADAAIVCALLVGIQERVLRTARQIRLHLAGRGVEGADAERIVETVLPFARAMTRYKGQLREPGHPGVRTDEPDFGG